MVESGLQPSDPAIPRITYKVGNAEDLAPAGVGVGHDGVDLAVAGACFKRNPCLSYRRPGSTLVRLPQGLAAAYPGRPAGWDRRVYSEPIFNGPDRPQVMAPRS